MLSKKQKNLSGLALIGAMYFGYYLAHGSFIPFINLYYERLGLSGVEIGTLAAIPVLISSSTVLIWGGVADALHWHRGILRIALVVSPIAVFLLSKVDNYSALIPIVVAYSFFISPVGPILDSSALEVADTFKSTYGNLRAWGAIGWAISTWLVGTLIENSTIYWLFYAYIVFMGFTFVISFLYPKRTKTLQSAWGYSFNKLLRRSNLLIFLFSIFLLCVTTGAVNSFFSLYLDGAGAGEGMIGLAWTVAALSEIPVMFASGFILKRYSSRGLLTLAFITYSLRWLLFSFITNPLLVLAVQLLHGFSFAAFLVGGVTYINELTPEGMGTSAQALFTTVSFGLGSIAGSLIGGYLYDTLGMVVLFRILCVVAAIGLIIFRLGNAPREMESIRVAP